MSAVHIPFSSYGLRRLPLLGEFLQREVKTMLFPFGRPAGGEWLGWGAKRSARRAQWYARQSGGRAIQLEDGFLRSYGTGDQFPPLSLVIDELGIYYDSTRPSSLEQLLASEVDLLAGISADVERAKQRLLNERLSKYNHAPLLDPQLLRDDDRQRVLVVDQTAGDLSVSLGAASGETFAEMLAAARRENPEATIYVKTHPEVTSGHKRGYLTHVQDDERTVVLRQAINPLSLIEQMERVYVVTSTMGFEALLAGKKVSVFGLPWYAGWGATEDRQSCHRRNRRRSVNELFGAAYFHYARYLDPLTHRRGTIFDVIDWLVHQREVARRFPGRMMAIGFPRWRAFNLAPLLSLTKQQLSFVRGARQAARLSPSHHDALLVWGRDTSAEVTALQKSSEARLLRVEDGFIRSVGLGSDLIRPQSLVLDGQGIYFDPTAPSELEELLNSVEFGEEELARARQLRAYIVEHALTKYNLEPLQGVSWRSDGRKVIFVPGQVEDDASIRYGCRDVNTNLGLLQAARRAEPEAFIVYKPHPDVVSGNRTGRLALAQAHQFADHIETQLSVVSCIDACDTVHTMSSLSGYDALLREKRVVVYGQPFYAGWGLTEDVSRDGEAFRRRQRRLTLDELVAGTMLRYPIYWDWQLNGYTTCEAVVRRIVETRRLYEARGQLEKLRSGWTRRQLRKLAVLLRAQLHN